MKRLTALAAALLLVAGMVSVASAAPTLDFMIDFGQDGTYDTYYQIQQGSSVKADIYFSVTEEGVIGGGFKLLYDPSLMSLSWDGYAPPFFDTGLGYSNPGDLGVVGQAFPPNTVVGPGEEIFGTLTLECLGLGLGSIMLYDFNTITDEWVTYPSGTVLDGQIPASGLLLAEVNQVPIPGAVWLLGSGLLGLVGLVRRRKH